MNEQATSQLINVLLLMGAVGVVHAMMQLGVSVLTLLSGHSLGSKRAHARMMRLNLGYIIGAFTIAALMVASLSFFIQSYFWLISFKTMFIGVSVLAILSSLSIIRFYYRKSPGTLLWIPRGLADYLTNRAKRTRNSFEAGALGALTVAMELPFTFSLFLIVAVFMLFVSAELRIWVTLGYALITVLPLLTITSLVGGGHRLSTIQRWREDNKYFLQYASSFGLLAITLFIILYYIKGVA